MIDLYSWATPNGHKIPIMLEETSLAYRVHPVNIRIGDQFKPEFLAVSPNNRIPAILDSDGPEGKPISLFGLVCGNRVAPSGPARRQGPRGRVSGRAIRR